MLAHVQAGIHDELAGAGWRTVLFQRFARMRRCRRFPVSLRVRELLLELADLHDSAL
jgi:hypothetical protein